MPSWLHEKSPNVKVPAVLYTSVGVSTVMFLLLGILGGMSMTFGGNDLIAVLNDPANSGTVLLTSRIATYIFPIAALLSGIPVISIIIRVGDTAALSVSGSLHPVCICKYERTSPLRFLARF